MNDDRAGERYWLMQAGLDEAQVRALDRWRTAHPNLELMKSTPEFSRLAFIRGLVLSGRLSDQERTDEHGTAE